MTIKVFTTGSTGGVVAGGKSAIAGSAGPWTIAFWFRLHTTGNTNKNLSWSGLFSNPVNGAQTSVACGYNATDRIDFYAAGGSGTNPFNGTSYYDIADTNWHHIAWRKNGSGASTFDKWLDGTMTQAVASLTLTLPVDEGLALGCKGVISNTFSPNVEIHEWLQVPYAVPDADLIAMAHGTPFYKLNQNYALGNYFLMDGVDKFKDKMGRLEFNYQTNLEASNPNIFESDELIEIEQPRKSPHWYHGAYPSHV